MAFYLLTETGERLLIEDGTGSLLLENSPIETTCGLLLEDGGSLLLEDGTGRLLLETCEQALPPATPEAPPPPTWGSGAGGSTEYRKPRRSDDLVRQLMELKRIQEMKLAQQSRITPYTPPRHQRQLLMLLPYFMEIIDSWDHSLVASNA